MKVSKPLAFIISAIVATLIMICSNLIRKDEPRFLDGCVFGVVMGVINTAVASWVTSKEKTEVDN
jgi:uncharacterized membrane protein YoaK (UPF0700 family)